MKIPIFLHHHIAYNNYTPENFEAELKYLKSENYKTLKLNQLLDFFNGKKLEGKYVMLTFDDGYADNYICAYPLLKKYGFNAVVFITTSYINDGHPRKTILEGENSPLLDKKTERMPDGFLRWQEIEIMIRDGVFEIGSHTHTHRNFKKDNIYKDIKEELIVSKDIIKTKLGIDVISLAWPWGDFNNEHVSIAQTIGYKLIFTTITGSVKENDFPFLIKRINVLPHRNISWFKKRLKFHTLPLISDIYPKVYGLDRHITNIWKKKK